MRLHSLSPAQAVLELDDSSPFSTAVVGAHRLELVVFWGDGTEPTRAAWRWRETRRVASWVEVGVA